MMVKEKVYGRFEDFRYHARLRRALSSVIARLPEGKPWQSSPLSLRGFPKESRGNLSLRAQKSVIASLPKGRVAMTKRTKSLRSSQ